MDDLQLSAQAIEQLVGKLLPSVRQDRLCVENLQTQLSMIVLATVFADLSGIAASLTYLLKVL